MTYRPRKRYKVLVTAFCLAVVAIVGVVFWQSLHSPVAGIYLVNGGTGAVRLAQAGTVVTAKEKYGFLEKAQWAGSVFGDGIDLDGRGASSGLFLEPQQITRLTLARSTHKPKDFDLHLADPVSDKWYLRLMQTFIRNEERLLTPTRPPVAQYFHRIDDSEIPAYFQALQNVEVPRVPGHDDGPAVHPPAGTAQLLAIAERLVQRHPGDLFVRGLLLDALVRAGDVDTLDKRVNLWRTEFEDTSITMPLAYEGYRLAMTHLEGWSTNKVQSNAFPMFLELLSRDTDLPKRLSLLKSISNYSATIPPQIRVEFFEKRVMNYLEAQTLVKCLQVMATLEAVQGNTDEAMSLAVSGFRFGQLIQNYDDFLITKLIAIAVKSLLTDTLGLLLLNGNQSVEELDRQWEMLERLNGYQVPLEQAQMTNEMIYQLPTRLPLMPNMEEANIRYNVASARFQVLRTAAAARRTFLESGEFPDGASATSMPPLLPKGLPLDVFDPTSASIRMRHDKDADSLVLYSVGPDKRNHKAHFQYDPTNGTTSEGDIFLHVPREREFPFPSKPQRADTTQTVADLYPLGLPDDSFARIDSQSPYAPNINRSINRRGYHQLQLHETSGTVYLFSEGPDSGRSWNPVDTINVPMSYDPTNGTISEGDIMMEVPRE